eukprot:s2227_g7.t1
MSLFGTWSEAAAINDLQEIQDHLGVGRQVWQAFTAQVGDPGNDIRLFGAFPRVAVVAACNQAQFQDGSPLLPIQATQVGLVWRLCRRVVAAKSGMNEDQFVDIDPWEEPSSGSVTGGNGPQGQGNNAPAGGVQSASIKDRVLKMSSLVDTQDESELLPPTNEEVNRWTQAYVAIMGSLPDPAEEPTSAQLAALSKRTLVHDCAPYVDFSVWTPFARRTVRNQKYRTVLPLGDGTYLTKELPGPVNFQMWLGCWRVFKSAALMLNICTLATLSNYERFIERLITQWPTCWGLIAQAEDKVRAEGLERWRRRIMTSVTLGRQVPVNWDPARPWTAVFDMIIQDVEYWAENVHHPAAAWLASGSRGRPVVASEVAIHAHLPGGSDWVNETQSDEGKRRAQANRDRRTAKKKKLWEDREELKKFRQGQNQSSGHETKFTQGSKGQSKGKTKDQSGKPLCFAWSAGNSPLVSVCACQLQCIGKPLRDMLQRSHEAVQMASSSETSDERSDRARRGPESGGPEGGSHQGAADPSPAEQLVETAKSAAVPDRVKVALEAAADFGKFRESRVFRFLHLFSGPDDRLAIALEAEGKRAGLTVKVESLDNRIDPNLDLRRHETVEALETRINQMEFDGYHAGFPCSSFSRVRWVEAANLPGPVRSRAHPYGLPTNTEKQQQEADAGTLMATKSLHLMEKQILSQRNRRVPQAATVENPPGDEDGPAGSAWLLQEVRETLETTGSGIADFNTCRYMDTKERFFKPGRWAGRLERLESLAQVCRCPAWVKHVPVTGKSTTLKAGIYPDKLCQEVAKLYVAAWKRTLELEFWRWKLVLKAEEVSSLKAGWLKNEEKKISERQRTMGPRRIGHVDEEYKTAEDNTATVAMDPEKESAPSSSVGDPKRLKREAENEFCIGGMRNPLDAVKKLWKVKNTGKRIRLAWEEFVKERPEALKLGEEYGSREAKFDEAIAMEWQVKLSTLLGVSARDGMTLQDKLMFKSPLNVDLWRAWFKETGDPDYHVAEWAEQGVPLGMHSPIPLSGGIFPSTGDITPELMEEGPEIEMQSHVTNYKSFVEAPEDAEIEVQRYVEKGFALLMDWDEVATHFDKGTVSRLALIVKDKPDGGVKRRVVVDLLRSGGNLRTHTPERIVLPRIVDVTRMARDLAAKNQQDNQGRSAEFVMYDLQDAFCHYPVSRPELANCLAPGNKPNQAILFRALLFGFKSAPLLMGRLSAAVGRVWQALMSPTEGSITYSAPKKMIDEVLETLKGWLTRGMVSHRELRSTTGRLSWICGILPRLRWTASVLFAVLRDAEEDERSGAEEARASKRPDTRPKLGLVAVKRFGATLKWLIAALSRIDRFALRREDLCETPVTLGILADASPLGMGAVLVSVTPGERTLYVLEAYEAKFTESEATLLGVKHGDSSSQGTVEALAILRAVNLWRTKIQHKAIFVRSDSVVALAMTRQLKGSTPQLNFVGGELSIALEEYNVKRLVAQHLPGVMNTEPDWLSRQHDRSSEIPAALRKVKIKQLPPMTTDNFVLTPPGARYGAWEGLPPHHVSVFHSL